MIVCGSIVRLIIGLLLGTLDGSLVRLIIGFLYTRLYDFTSRSKAKFLVGNKISMGMILYEHYWFGSRSEWFSIGLANILYFRSIVQNLMIPGENLGV